MIENILKQLSEEFIKNLKDKEFKAVLKNMILEDYWNSFWISQKRTKKNLNSFGTPRIIEKDTMTSINFK